MFLLTLSMRWFLLISSLFTSLFTYTQVGGRGVYSFLDLTYSGRTTALGGEIVSLFGNDVNLTHHNPSAINHIENHQIGLNYVNYIADINFTQFNYQLGDLHKTKNLGKGSFSINYLGYGDFIEADEFGQQIGSFNANDLVLTQHWGISLDSLFSVGVSYHNIFSNYYTYNSWGMAFDLGASYFNPKNELGIGLVFNSIGAQITTYSDTREPLPFEIIFGVSKRLAHAPFIVNFTFHDLQQIDIFYQDPVNPPQTVDPLTGEEIKPKNYIGQKVLRHVNMALEFVPSPNFNLRVAYNYQRQKELSISNKGGLVGFSFGAGIKVKKFKIDYGRAVYHLGGTSNALTISTNLSSF